MDNLYSELSNFYLEIAAGIAVLGAITSVLIQRLLGNLSLKTIVASFVIAIAGFSALIFLIVSDPTLTSRVAAKVERLLFSEPGKPIIVGIYPSDVFGPFHKDGVHAVLEGVIDEFRIIDLTLPYAQMKSGKISSLVKQLKYIIVRKNVVGIVGPPVTEITKQVLQTVRSTGRPVPVIITSATTRSNAGWDKNYQNVFRINSGIDERAADFAALARNVTSKGIRMLFLVETLPTSRNPSYGEIAFEAIANNLPEWKSWVAAGLVSHKRYLRGRIVNAMTRWGADEVLGRDQIVMILGIGSDYKAFIKAFYSSESNRRRSSVGGWMNAYAVESGYRKKTYQWSRLFEITDLDFRRGSENITQLQERFSKQFGVPTPSKRDQAFSFDATNIFVQSFWAVRDRHSNDKSLNVNDAFLNEIVAHISQNSWVGVTGEIKFSENGQNHEAKSLGEPNLIYAVFEPESGVWKAIPTVSALLERHAKAQ